MSFFHGGGPGIRGPGTLGDSGVNNVASRLSRHRHRARQGRDSERISYVVVQNQQRASAPVISRSSLIGPGPGVVAGVDDACGLASAWLQQVGAWQPAGWRMHSWLCSHGSFFSDVLQ